MFRAKMRGVTVRGLDWMLRLGPSDATQKYLTGVSHIPEAWGNGRVRQVLANLPSHGTFLVRVPMDLTSFAYETVPGDSFHLSCRSGFVDYEPASRALFGQLAAKAHAVVDVGAYSGIYTLTALAANPQVVVHSFEPNPFPLSRLTRNVEVNRATDRVTCHNVALAESRRIAEFYPNALTSVSTLGALELNQSQPQGKPLSVQVSTLDSELNDERIDLIKVDIEGGEPDFFRGAESVLRTWFPVVLSEALMVADLNAQAGILSQVGYDAPIRVSSTSQSDARNYLWMHERSQPQLREVVRAYFESCETK